MNTGRITEYELPVMVLKVCDSFRGRVESAHYRNIVLAIFFLKYISDVHEDTLLNNRFKYGEDKERIERAMRYARFIVSEKSSFAYLYRHRHEAHIGEMMNVALSMVEEENSELFAGGDLQGLFRNTDFTSQEVGDRKARNELIKNLFEVFIKLNLYSYNQDEEPIAGELFLFLAERLTYEAGAGKGEFFTPKSVCTLLAKLTKSSPGSQIYDPAAGSGELLIQAAREVGNSNFSLYGEEISYNIRTISGMNMLFHGIDSAQIALGDTLRKPQFVDNHHSLKQFDTVISHPPFSLSNWGQKKHYTIVITAFTERFLLIAKLTGHLSATCLLWPVRIKEE